MKTKYLFLFFLLSSLTLNAQTTITLLHYNDLHAHLVSHKDMIRVGDTCATDPTATFVLGERGGLARLKTKIDQEKTANPLNILMNIGDTYHGGVEAAYTSGNAIVDPVNALGIDVGVPGNWDFAYGPGVFRKRYTPTGPFPTILNSTLPSYAIKSPNFPYLAANLTYQKLGPSDPSVTGAQVLPPTMEITRGGIKIGFIGITSDIVAQMYQTLALGFIFTQGETNYKTLIETKATELRTNGCKMVCVMSELGIQKDYRLSQIITTGLVDVFFSAHTHEETYKPLQFNSTTPWVVEAGNDGFLGKMDVTFDASGNIINKYWILMSIKNDIVPNTAMQTLVNTERAPFLTADPNLVDPMGTSSQALHRPITAVAGTTNGLLTRKNALESSFNNSLTNIMATHANKQVAITPGFRFDSPVANSGFLFEDNTIANGNITVEDIYRFYPVFYTLATANTTGSNLKLILEKLLKSVYSQTAFNQSGGWVDGFSGIDATVNLDNPDDSKVINMFYRGTTNPINPTDNITVIGCVRPNEDADVLCSHTGFTGKADYINPANSQPYTAIQLLEEYLTTNVFNVDTVKHITDLSGQSQYYQSPFVQPVYNANCITTTALNTEGWNIQNMVIYPNPTKNEIFISSGIEIQSINIVNSIGQMVISKNINSQSAAINVENLAKGMYIISVVSDNNKIENQKFIKE
jgi:2',3'-cyclic-nucleotide 2'-phosphodiesterase (5'-nucleotidase family)